MKCAKWATSTTKLTHPTHPICLAHSFRSSFIKNALRSAQALEVKCVNVLELHAVVTTDEYVFLAVELCEGCLGRGDFFDTFKLSISERLGLCRQIVVGVNHLHAVGVWHRDIKPGNVLFKQDADNGGLVLKIADMGISKVASEKTLQTVTNASAGTPTYMPFELLDDEEEDQGGKATKEVSERSERALRKTASF